jgi:hypothetical protein
MNSLENICLEQDISFSKKNSHIRCLAHVINLAAQDALSSLKANHFENEDEIFDQVEINGVIPKVRIICCILLN